ncbi:DUF4439 domain-containing protein [Isoptericola cucumis]|uniref:DUF4439 domain-containing protein n=1 Tax=Isoptericola cucumis TaxID=1776856 RepID=A0ABQ2B4M7_9MICO|nr:DUF4439 domain-containing protein [Isoptericola cucumis]GGI07767.1 hypothetical protein GCM10007368_17810 [Isoptericola cucumis]
MDSCPCTAPSARRAERRRRAAGSVALLLAAGLTAGCGVRLEAPPPAEPVPDALEVVRRTAVSDALLVADRAELALESVPVAQERMITELSRVAADSRTQATELGGVYDSGLAVDDPSVSPAGSPSQEIAEVPDVVQALVDAAARSRTAAGSTTDGPMARLLASVGAAQTVSAGRLADLADVAGPEPVDAQVPEPTGEGRAAEPGSPSGSGTPTPEQSEDAPTQDAPSEGADGESPDPDGQEDGVVPEGLTAKELSSLVVTEDSAGYAMRLRAAIADGSLRDRLLARTRAHGDRARGWAEVAGTQDTAQDPRRAAYAVPRVAEENDKALVRTLEDGLATDYATLVARTAPGTRMVLVDLLVDSAVALDDWGAEPAPFPGLPEQAGDDAG